MIAPLKRVPMLSVIIGTWNSKKYVHECLGSVDRYAELTTEIIVVDNASTDGTPELIAQKFPNLGCSKANNIGIRRSCGKYVCLINSDVVLPRGCLNILFQYMEAHPNVGMVGPKMIGPDGVTRRSTMRLPSLRNSVCRAVGVDRSPLLSRILGGQMMSWSRLGSWTNGSSSTARTWTCAIDSEVQGGDLCFPPRQLRSTMAERVPVRRQFDSISKCSALTFSIGESITASLRLLQIMCCCAFTTFFVCSAIQLYSFYLSAIVLRSNTKCGVVGAFWQG
jgi:glycosyltransferase involved in cell wall biosynthesis